MKFLESVLLLILGVIIFLGVIEFVEVIYEFFYDSANKLTWNSNQVGMTIYRAIQVFTGMFLALFIPQKLSSWDYDEKLGVHLFVSLITLIIFGASGDNLPGVSIVVTEKYIYGVSAFSILLACGLNALIVIIARDNLVSPFIPWNELTLEERHKYINAFKRRPHTVEIAIKWNYKESDPTWMKDLEIRDAYQEEE